MDQSIQHLISHVSQLVEHQHEINAITGRDFNIFQALVLESNEDRLHSRLLGYLLSPKAAHGQGTLFLRRFFETLKIDADPAQFKVVLEKSVGFVDKDKIEGGRIDILIYNHSGLAYAIENKIYADEMPEQLQRYANYLKIFHGSQYSQVLFLTLDGKNSAVHETFSSYHSISYCTDILSWLETCRIDVIDKPVIRETIKQYINTIKRLTGQNTESTMNDKIFKYLDTTNNKEAYFAILNSFQAYRKKSLEHFAAKFSEKIKDEASIKLFVSGNLGVKDSSIKIEKDEWGDKYLMLYFLTDYADVAFGIHSETYPDPINRLELYKYLSQFSGFKTKLLDKLKNWWWIADITSFPNMKSHQYEEWDRLVSDEFVTDLVENIRDVIELADRFFKSVRK